MNEHQRWLPWAAGGWALIYAVYRAYYALGGTAGMLGTPVSIGSWYAINTVAAILLLVAAVLPVATRRLWHRAPWRLALLSIAWVVAVGCTMHALVGITTRILSLAGLLTIDYPFWATIDRTAADLQALLWNEPWFLVEGLLWAALGWVVLETDAGRRRWVISIAAGTAILVLTGLLSATGIIGRFVVG